jgi:hypothetical protein
VKEVFMDVFLDQLHGFAVLVVMPGVILLLPHLFCDTGRPAAKTKTAC